MKFQTQLLQVSKAIETSANRTLDGRTYTSISLGTLLLTKILTDLSKWSNQCQGSNGTWHSVLLCWVLVFLFKFFYWNWLSLNFVEAYNEYAGVLGSWLNCARAIVSYSLIEWNSLLIKAFILSSLLQQAA